MMRPLRSSVLLILSVLVTETWTQRIIGGQEVQPYSIKYQASLQSDTRQHYCGGTLVHPRWVVSAAHCWRPSASIRVVLSEHNLLEDEGFEQVFNVSKIYVHQYNYKTFNNDIMIIKLSEPAQLNAYVQPVQVASDSTPTLDGRVTCTVSGWGVTRIYDYILSPVLRAVDVEIISYCSYYYWGRITNNMICAGSQFRGKDSCQGDSGGALVCKGNFEGIVSWRISCANPYYPGVYTKVRNYNTWINWIINNDQP